MYVTSNNATKMIAKYGNMYLITLSIVTPPTRQPVKRIVPTGGVIVPIDKLKQPLGIAAVSFHASVLYMARTRFFAVPRTALKSWRASEK